MVRSGKAITWVVFFGLAGFFGSGEDIQAQAQWGATVRVDTVLAQPGSQVGVPVRLIDNEMEYRGLQIPLQSRSPFLTFDSISTVGSIITPDFDLLVQLQPGADTMEMTVIQRDFLQNPIPSMPAIDGLIAVIWVTLAPNASLGVALIDSLAIDTLIGEPGSQFRYWKFVNGADRYGTTILPAFIPGGVRVEQATDVADDRNLLPSDFGLAQNYPNPFNPSTVIGFALPHGSEIKLAVFNLLGQEVDMVAKGRFPAGYHEVTFDASAHPSGVYLYRLDYAGGSRTRKMVLLK